MTTPTLKKQTATAVVDLPTYPGAEDARLLAAFACQELDLAATRILASEMPDVAGTGVTLDLAPELAGLTGAIHAHLRGGGTHAASLASSPLRLRLLQHLRAHLVDRWSIDCNSDDLPRAIRILAALERVGETLQISEEEDVSSGSLSGPNAKAFVSEIAHDLRSPLTSILTLAETLRNGYSGDVNDVQRRQLGLIYSAALALSTTASDVMELAHDADLLGEEHAPLSLRQILDSVRDIVLPMAEEKGIDVRLTSPAQDHRLGHGLALSRILLNLTTNSLKFTRAGFVEVAIRPSTPTRLEFSVRDTGPGIRPDALSTLFQPFRREPGRTGYYFSGTGLGLSIVRKLVAALGSKLNLETRPGWGTRLSFELELPPVPARF
jgi:signal transduction histidine kinase